jgi:O-acetyl-ADP-ribose deacetylase (regulator of RNase III)
MIESKSGNLLNADVEALVNTVNTVGVMGKGIALQFRKAFPANYKAYKLACDRDEVRPGKMFVFQTGQIENPKLIINFPTKRHWKGKTRVEDIESGLVDLIRVLREADVKSVAIPPLGCGNGGLEWSRVRPLIETALAPLEDIEIQLFEPTGAPDPAEQRIATPRPNMTLGRAVLLAALETYRADPAAQITHLVVQKLAYLLQAAGQPLRLNFAKGQFGPYAENLNHVLQAIDGHFIKGVGDRTAEVTMELDDEAVHQAWLFLGDDADSKRKIERVYSLINGFESPLGLELLSTVHWTAHREGSTNANEALEQVGAWTERKKRTFRSQHVNAAWKRLDDEQWLPPQLQAAGH